MIIKNSPSTKRSNQTKDKEQIIYYYKECFKRENTSILDDSELIKIIMILSNQLNHGDYTK